jgi:hypothetical protein
MDHDHDHARAASRRALSVALALTASYTVVEVVGGILTGSLALLADAVHMLSDNVALGVALFAAWLAAKSAAISGLLDRPVPDVTKADYPPLLAAGFFAALGLSFTSGLLGLAGVGFAGALGCAFVILGMGVIHVVLSQTVMKPFILVFIYLGLSLTPWIAPVIAAIGLLEPLLHLRQRSVQPTTPPPGSGAGPNR